MPRKLTDTERTQFHMMKPKVVCGKCKIEMKEIGCLPNDINSTRYRCGKCGYTVLITLSW